MGTKPGIHKTVDIEMLDYAEKRVTAALAQSFYITSGGTEEIGNARYKYLTLRPAERIAHVIPGSREIVFLFSPYENFEVRTLQAFVKISDRYDGIRINTRFRMLASRDPAISVKIQKIGSDEPDLPVTIPFVYNELHGDDVHSHLVNAVRSSYHFRDLFAQRNALQEDTYFYGRSDFIKSALDRIGRCDNIGIFGLRKSGKTSILYALERALSDSRQRYIFIDCQSPSVYTTSWNNLLRDIATQLRDSASLTTKASRVGDFTESSAYIDFEKSVNDCYSRDKKTFVIALDEIEHISPETGSIQWRDGENPLKFWQTLRAFQQKNRGKLCFVVAGTNPRITETPKMGGSDNPILEYIHCEYLKGLSEEELVSMCSELGNLMGLNFDLSALNFLNANFGGHPFLTRQVCSEIHKKADHKKRPVTVDESLVSNAIQSVNFSPLLDDIVSSISERYPDEYECLKMIANGNSETAKDYISLDPAFLSHLEGYGIVSVHDGDVKGELGILMQHLRKKANPSELFRSVPDRWGQVVIKRGKLEQNLRSAVRERLIGLAGRSESVSLLCRTLSNKRTESLIHLSLDDIFSVDRSPLFFTDLISFIQNDRKFWAQRLRSDFEEINDKLMLINRLRLDAHANQLTDAEFDLVLKSIDWISAEL